MGTILNRTFIISPAWFIRMVWVVPGRKLMPKETLLFVRFLGILAILPHKCGVFDGRFKVIMQAIVQICVRSAGTVNIKSTVSTWLTKRINTWFNLGNPAMDIRTRQIVMAEQIRLNHFRSLHFKKVRLYCKLFSRRVLGLHGPSYCRACGRTVHDFSAPDEIWRLVDPHIRYGHTLCYDCFCEICSMLGLPSVWRLEKMIERQIQEQGTK